MMDAPEMDMAKVCEDAYERLNKSARAGKLWIDDGWYTESDKWVTLDDASRALRASIAAVAQAVGMECYLLGFNASGEGYNGEYPFRGKNVSPDTVRSWIEDRDTAIRALLSRIER